MPVSNALAYSSKRSTTNRDDSDDIRKLKAACSKLINDQSFGIYGKKEPRGTSQVISKRVGTICDKSKKKSNGKENTEEKLRKSMENSKQLQNLRQEARVAQRSREEREDERRKRIDELKSRNNDRRSRVEERKRLLCEAEREKREAILRKSQEAEARIEIRKIQEKEKKKPKRIVEKLNKPVAFGSSTPRLLCPNETSDSFCSSCWSITKDHDKTQTSFVGRPSKKFNGVESARGRSVTPSPIQPNRKPMNRTGHGTPKGESIYTTSIKLARKSSVCSGDTTPSSGQSRSSSFTSRYSATSSLDSNGTIGSCRRSIFQRTTKPVGAIGNVIPITVETDKPNRNGKLTTIKSGIPKLVNGRRITSTSTPVGTKTRLEVKNSKMKEEEEQNLMEETMRLANEMLEIEKQRLKITIEETKRWEEEEQRKQEEKAKKRREKEEAERKAREEAERYRIEIAEKLRRDSEERSERRKRVQIIMLRTRGENRFGNTEEIHGRSR